jgi:hypothetical protein
LGRTDRRRFVLFGPPRRCTAHATAPREVIAALAGVFTGVEAGGLRQDVSGRTLADTRRGWRPGGAGDRRIAA